MITFLIIIGNYFWIKLIFIGLILVNLILLKQLFIDLILTAFSS